MAAGRCFGDNIQTRPKMYVETMMLGLTSWLANARLHVVCDSLAWPCNTGLLQWAVCTSLVGRVLPWQVATVDVGAVKSELLMPT